jgi:hypothetical protein
MRVLSPDPKSTCKKLVPASTLKFYFPLLTLYSSIRRGSSERPCCGSHNIVFGVAFDKVEVDSFAKNCVIYIAEAAIFTHRVLQIDSPQRRVPA